MFGQTNPFGQSSSSPFTSQFGQSSTGNSNPFASNPFGSMTTPFGSQTGGSIFGGTSTGVFGTAQSSSPLGSTAFGSSMPSFGATTAPTFGSSSPAFGGSSVFGQKPAFGGFGSTPTQTSLFGSNSQPSQPAFGSNLFGSTSTPFGGANQPAFGTTTTPTFGSTGTSAFGAATTTPSFGASNTTPFGATNTTPTFGSTPSPTFGSTGSAFGMSGTPAFGAPTTTPTFGTSGSAFGASTTTPTFGASTTPSFSFGSSPFGQTSSAFGSSPFGTTTSPFGAQSSAFGAQTTTPAFGNASFGQSTLGSQRGGSRVAPYTPTTEVDGTSSTQTAGKLESISAMPIYKEKSHEELRWEDYQQGDKGGPNPAGQSSSGIGFNTSATQSSPFQSSSTFGQSSSNPFSTTTPSNPFGAPTSAFGTSSTSAFSPSPFASQSTANPFGSTSNASATPSLFGTTTSGFGSNPSPSIFGTTSSSAFGSSPSLFGPGSAQGTTPAFNTGLNLGGTQSSPLFQSTTPSFGQTASAFGQTTSAFGPNTSAFGQNSTSPFGQSNLFSSPSTGFGGNLFSSTPSLLSSSNPGGFSQTNTSLSTPFQLAQPAQTNSGFGFGNFGQTQAAATSGFGGSSSIFGQSLFGQPSAGQGTAQAIQPAPITNPYGTLPAMPQMSIGRSGNSPTVQYGISSMPVIEKPAPVRISSLLTARHFTQRRIRLPARKYNPKKDGPKVPFFSDDEETSSTPKADALFIPRENPRALVIRPMEQWSSKANAEKTSPLEEPSTPVYTNGKSSDSNGSNGDYKGKKTVDENGLSKEANHSSKLNQKPPNNGVHIDLTKEKEESSKTLTGSHIDSLVPTLHRSDYYTEPSIKELSAKERADPGFTTRVKNFVIGRHEYGSIKFLGETNVRGLDLESLVQFNNREVIVYLDDTKKPPVGQGLNKPAEVTLLNIKCFDKKTRKQYKDGPKIEKYKEMLKKKAEEQGAEFVSYDPVEGEWKFKVSHFSMYKLGEDDDWENMV